MARARARSRHGTRLGGFGFRLGLLGQDRRIVIQCVG
jgi:hypothetical protein